MGRLLYAEALEIYERIMEHVENPPFDLVMQAGTCYRRLGRLDDSQELFQWRTFGCLLGIPHD